VERRSGFGRRKTRNWQLMDDLVGQDAKWQYVYLCIINIIIINNLVTYFNIYYLIKRIFGGEDKFE